MDFIFCCSDNCNVSVDADHSSLVRSSSFSSLWWYHLQNLSSDIFLVSSLQVSEPHQACFPASLCDILYIQSLPDRIIPYMISYCVAARPSSHHHLCYFQFLHVGASHWHCLKKICMHLPNTCGGGESGRNVGKNCLQGCLEESSEGKGLV